MPAVNYDALVLFAKFGGIILGLLLIVWLIAVLTPKAAKLIDRLLGKPRPARVEDNIDKENNESSPENYKVYSIFEDRPLQKQDVEKQEARDGEE